MSLHTPSLPSARIIHVDTRGAVILSEESPETRDSRGIYLPNYIEPVSHIAVDIGGSLAKVVYFTRSPEPPSSPSVAATHGSSSASNLSSPRSVSPSHDASSTHSSPGTCTNNKVNGALTPLVLEQPMTNGSGPSGFSEGLLHESILKRTAAAAAAVQHFPGGSLNFERFETDNIDACVEFIQELIERSAHLNGVSIEEMRKGVKIMATGGGAHKFYEMFSDTLHVDVRREDEMECLIEGLQFITLIPDEVYYFSDEVIHSVSHPTTSTSTTPNIPPPLICPSLEAEGLQPIHAKASLPQTSPPILERPSPDPPKYGVTFESHPTPQFPCLLVNIGSGVSIIKVDEDGAFERVSGTSLGGGTLWGLLSLLTPATTFDEMLAFSEQGDNSTVDMLVGDIYGQDYSKLGLKSTMIASTFGKVFKKGGEKGKFSAEDISKSLLYAVSNNIGQIAYMNAEKYNLNKIYFGGCFIRGHAATIATLSYAIRFWSKGTKRALFLRHEGFLGSIGAWIRNIDASDEVAEHAHVHGKVKPSS
ncbi:pantothenate kinase [Flammula alnicola]|nr:pantothenate kinase [Flammula alnicola]